MEDAGQEMTSHICRFLHCQIVQNLRRKVKVRFTFLCLYVVCVRLAALSVPSVQTNMTLKMLDAEHTLLFGFWGFNLIFQGKALTEHTSELSVTSDVSLRFVIKVKSNLPFRPL